LPKTYLKELENAGVQVMFYRPKISPWTLKKIRLRRMHRKIAVIDERIAYVGGINIIDDYNVPDNTPPRIDYAVRIEGALLPSIAASVVKLWHRMQWMRLRGLVARINPAGRIKANQANSVKQAQNATKAQHHEQNGLKKEIKQDMQAAFVLRDNLLHRKDIENAYLSAINTAKSEIIFANAYFVPGRKFRKSLLKAAQRGVKIELLLQGRMEYFLMFATYAFYGLFLKNGVQIFEYRKSFMHGKVAVIDGYWATVGSSNIDPFSMMLAREANIVAQNKAFANELRSEILSSIREGSHQVSAQEWLHGKRAKRLLSWLVYGMVRVFMGAIGYSNEH
jgi:cardiolipin synthase